MERPRRPSRLTHIRETLRSLMGEPPLPKPAHYRDTVTRSRLEGYWLVFLDGIGCRWCYEPETLDLPHTRYMPDVWLTREETWLEIKPAGTTADDRLGAACAEQTGCPLIWCAGSPRPGDYELTLFLPGHEPYRNLRWAVGRRDHDELWVCNVGLGFAMRLARPAVPLSWEVEAGGFQFPLFDCAVLRDAYRRASTWEFHP